MPKVRSGEDPLRPGVLRRFWPVRHPCPFCAQRGITALEFDKVGCKGLKQYRKCAGCKLVYSVAAIAEEVDQGDGRPSRIVFRAT